MIARAHTKPADEWSALLEVLEGGSSYGDRLDALLDRVVEIAGLPAAYLYVLDDSGRRFELARTHNSGPGLPEAVGASKAASTAEGSNGSASALAVMDPAVEGGAGSVLPTPPLELPKGAGDVAGVVSTPVGSLFSMPLTAGGEVVGLVQAGPVKDRGAHGRTRRRLEGAAVPLSVVVRQARREDALRQQAAAATARLEAGQKLIGSSLDLDRFVSLLLDLALKATRTDAGFVATAEPGSAVLSVRTHQNMPTDFTEVVDLSPDTGMFDWSPATTGMLFLRDFEAAEPFGARSILAVPLMAGKDPLGVFALINYGESETFVDHSLDLLETFAEQVRLMLSNRRLFADFAEQYLGTLTGLAESLDVRRPHLHRHHVKVSLAAAALAGGLRLSRVECEAVAMAGRIHDVGMAGIVGADVEADLQHPVVGASLVTQLPIHPAVGEAVATHHEWFDGWGYPRGLKGEAIPMAGRILAMSEFLVEMASGDPVREPWDGPRLVRELELRRGSQFDPKVTDAGIRLAPTLAAEISSLGADPIPAPETKEH